MADDIVIVNEESVTLIINDPVIEVIEVTSPVIEVVTVGAQGPMGPPGVTGVPYFEPEASTNVLLGQVAYVDNLGKVGLANASVIGKDAIGLITLDANATIGTRVQTDGQLTLLDWSNSTSNTTLIPGQEYWLGVIDGQLATIPPAGTGVFFQKIGVAISSDTMVIAIEKFGRR